MTDYQLTLWQRWVANFCVALGPLLVFAAAIASNLPGWAQVGIAALGVTVAWVAKNWQSKLDIKAEPK